MSRETREALVEFVGCFAVFLVVMSVIGLVWLQIHNSHETKQKEVSICEKVVDPAACLAGIEGTFYSPRTQ